MYVEVKHYDAGKSAFPTTFNFNFYSTNDASKQIDGSKDVSVYWLNYRLGYITRVNKGDGGLMGELILATTLCKIGSADLSTVKYYTLPNNNKLE